MDTQLTYQATDAKNQPEQFSNRSKSRWTHVRCFFELFYFFRERPLNRLMVASSFFGQKCLEGSFGLGPTFATLMKYKDQHDVSRLKITAFNHAGKMLAGSIKKNDLGKKVDYRVIDLGNMPYSTTEFDGVTIANSFHVIPELGTALIEIRRILKFDGTLSGNAILRPRGKGVLGRISRFLYDQGIRNRLWIRGSEDKIIKSALEKQGFQLIFEETTNDSYNFIAKKI